MIDPQCRLCTLHLTRKNVVQPDLPVGECKVLFVGRDGGEQEDIHGSALLPFAPAGKLLRAMITEVGIDIATCGFDNVVHCHTPDNRGPLPHEVQACRQWVGVVQRSVRPPIVVLLGQEAIEAWFNPSGYNPKKPKYVLKEVSGTKLIQEDGTVVVPTHHPSSALRNSKNKAHLRTALRVVARELGLGFNGPEFTVVPSEILLEVVQWSGIVVIDAEWTRNGDILGVGFASRDSRSALAMAAWMTSGYRGMLEALPPGTTVIGHNISSDFKALVLPPWLTDTWNVEDTMLQALVLGKRERLGGVGLKDLALKDLGLSWETLEELGLPEDLESDKLGYYCLCDCTATLELWYKQKEELKGVQRLHS